MESCVALVVAGMGSLGSSLVAGIEAARRGLGLPHGSLAETGAEPWRGLAPLAPLHALKLGAFELREDDALRTALRAGVVPRALLSELAAPLRALRPMSGARRAPTRLHLAEALADDLRGFAVHHGCARGVLVCTVPGPAHCARLPRTPEELWAALEQSADEVTPGLVYAAAAARAGFGFVAAARDPSLAAPALPQLFQRAGTPLAGCGLLGPEAALRDALGQVAAAEGLLLSGAASLQARETATWPGARTQEIAVAPAWAQGTLELSCELRGPLALHRAARALDAALLAELALRAGSAGAQTWMDALFEAPLGVERQQRAEAPSLRERRRLLLQTLPGLAAHAAAADAAAAPAASSAGFTGSAAADAAGAKPAARSAARSAAA